MKIKLKSKSTFLYLFYIFIITPTIYIIAHFMEAFLDNHTTLECHCLDEPSILAFVLAGLLIAIPIVIFKLYKKRKNIIKVDN